VAAERFEAGEAAESAGVVAGSIAALRNDNVKRVHLLDDGFQHRQLVRTMDVVLVTAEDLEDSLLPAGNLREPFAGLCRADVVVVRDDEREQVVPKLQGSVRSDVPIWMIRRQIGFPDGAVLQSNVSTPGHVVFCAIARPANFFNMLKAAGVHGLKMVAFPDHHRYRADDMNKLVEILRDSNGKGFITTEKDAVKLSPAMRARLEAAGPLVVARLDAIFVDEDKVARDLELQVARDLELQGLEARDLELQGLEARIS
jgi:tetraacyldisaccharide 4'-kinase